MASDSASSDSDVAPHRSSVVADFRDAVGCGTATFAEDGSVQEEAVTGVLEQWQEYYAGVTEPEKPEEEELLLAAHHLLHIRRLLNAGKYVEVEAALHSIPVLHAAAHPELEAVAAAVERRLLLGKLAEALRAGGVELAPDGHSVAPSGIMESRLAAALAASKDAASRSALVNRCRSIASRMRRLRAAFLALDMDAASAAIDDVAGLAADTELRDMPVLPAGHIQAELDAAMAVVENHTVLLELCQALQNIPSNLISSTLVRGGEGGVSLPELVLAEGGEGALDAVADVLAESEDFNPESQLVQQIMAAASLLQAVNGAAFAMAADVTAARRREVGQGGDLPGTRAALAAGRQQLEECLAMLKDVLDELGSDIQSMPSLLLRSAAERSGALQPGAEVDELSEEDFTDFQRQAVEVMHACGYSDAVDTLSHLRQLVAHCETWMLVFERQCLDLDSAHSAGDVQEASEGPDTQELSLEPEDGPGRPEGVHSARATPAQGSSSATQSPAGPSQHSSDADDASSSGSSTTTLDSQASGEAVAHDAGSGSPVVESRAGGESPLESDSVGEDADDLLARIQAETGLFLGAVQSSGTAYSAEDSGSEHAGEEHVGLHEGRGQEHTPAPAEVPASAASHPAATSEGDASGRASSTASSAASPNPASEAGGSVPLAASKPKPVGDSPPKKILGHSQGRTEPNPVPNPRAMLALAARKVGSTPPSPAAAGRRQAAAAPGPMLHAVAGSHTSDRNGGELAPAGHSAASQRGRSGWMRGDGSGMQMSGAAPAKAALPARKAGQSDPSPYLHTPAPFRRSGEVSATPSPRPPPPQPSIAAAVHEASSAAPREQKTSSPRVQASSPLRSEQGRDETGGQPMPQASPPVQAVSPASVHSSSPPPIPRQGAQFAADQAVRPPVHDGSAQSAVQESSAASGSASFSSGGRAAPSSLAAAGSPQVDALSCPPTDQEPPSVRKGGGPGASQQAEPTSTNMAPGSARDATTAESSEQPHSTPSPAMAADKPTHVQSKPSFLDETVQQALVPQHLPSRELVLPSAVDLPANSTGRTLLAVRRALKHGANPSAEAGGPSDTAFTETLLSALTGPKVAARGDSLASSPAALPDLKHCAGLLKPAEAAALQCTHGKVLMPRDTVWPQAPEGQQAHLATALAITPSHAMLALPEHHVSLLALGPHTRGAGLWLTAVAELDRAVLWEEWGGVWDGLARLAPALPPRALPPAWLALLCAGSGKAAAQQGPAAPLQASATRLRKLLNVAESASAGIAGVGSAAPSHTTRLSAAHPGLAKRRAEWVERVDSWLRESVLPGVLADMAAAAPLVEQEVAPRLQALARAVLSKAAEKAACQASRAIRPEHVFAALPQELCQLIAPRFAPSQQSVTALHQAMRELEQATADVDVVCETLNHGSAPCAQPERQHDAPLLQHAQAALKAAQQRDWPGLAKAVAQAALQSGNRAQAGLVGAATGLAMGPLHGSVDALDRPASGLKLDLGGTFLAPQLAAAASYLPRELLGDSEASASIVPPFAADQPPHVPLLAAPGQAKLSSPHPAVPVAAVSLGSSSSGAPEAASSAKQAAPSTPRGQDSAARAGAFNTPPSHTSAQSMPWAVEGDAPGRDWVLLQPMVTAQDEAALFGPGSPTASPGLAGRTVLRALAGEAERERVAGLGSTQASREGLVPALRLLWGAAQAAMHRQRISHEMATNLPRTPHLSSRPPTSEPAVSPSRVLGSMGTTRKTQHRVAAAKAELDATADATKALVSALGLAPSHPEGFGGRGAGSTSASPSSPRGDEEWGLVSSAQTSPASRPGESLLLQTHSSKSSEPDTLGRVADLLLAMRHAHDAGDWSAVGEVVDAARAALGQLLLSDSPHMSTQVPSRHAGHSSQRVPPRTHGAAATPGLPRLHSLDDAALAAAEHLAHETQAAAMELAARVSLQALLCGLQASQSVSSAVADPAVPPAALLARVPRAGKGGQRKQGVGGSGPTQRAPDLAHLVSALDRGLMRAKQASEMGDGSPQLSQYRPGADRPGASSALGKALRTLSAAVSTPRLPPYITSCLGAAQRLLSMRKAASGAQWPTLLALCLANPPPPYQAAGSQRDRDTSAQGAGSLLQGDFSAWCQAVGVPADAVSAASHASLTSSEPMAGMWDAQPSLGGSEVSLARHAAAAARLVATEAAYWRNVAQTESGIAAVLPAAEEAAAALQADAMQEQLARLSLLGVPGVHPPPQPVWSKLLRAGLGSGDVISAPPSVGAGDRQQWDPSRRYATVEVAGAGGLRTRAGEVWAPVPAQLLPADMSPPAGSSLPPPRTWMRVALVPLPSIAASVEGERDGLLGTHAPGSTQSDVSAYALEGMERIPTPDNVQRRVQAVAHRAQQLSRLHAEVEDALGSGDEALMARALAQGKAMGLSLAALKPRPGGLHKPRPVGSDAPVSGPPLLGSSHAAPQSAAVAVPDATLGLLQRAAATLAKRHQHRAMAAAAVKERDIPTARRMVADIDAAGDAGALPADLLADLRALASETAATTALARLAELSAQPAEGVDADALIAAAAQARLHMGRTEAAGGEDGAATTGSGAALSPRLLSMQENTTFGGQAALVAPLHHYRIKAYPNLRSSDEFEELSGVPGAGAGMLMHSSAGLGTSLTKQPQGVIMLTRRMFRTVQGVLGDSSLHAPAQGGVDWISPPVVEGVTALVHIGCIVQYLVDELVLQCIKQLSGSPPDVAMTRGWVLLHCLLSFCAVPTSFMPYLEAWLVQQSKPGILETLYRAHIARAHGTHGWAPEQPRGIPARGRRRRASVLRSEHAAAGAPALPPALASAGTSILDIMPGLAAATHATPEALMSLPSHDEVESALRTASAAAAGGWTSDLVVLPHTSRPPAAGPRSSPYKAVPTTPAGAAAAALRKTLQTVAPGVSPPMTSPPSSQRQTQMQLSSPGYALAELWDSLPVQPQERHGSGAHASDSDGASSLPSLASTQLEEEGSEGPSPRARHPPSRIPIPHPTRRHGSHLVEYPPGVDTPTGLSVRSRRRLEASRAERPESTRRGPLRKVKGVPRRLPVELSESSSVLELDAGSPGSLHPQTWRVPAVAPVKPEPRTTAYLPAPLPSAAGGKQDAAGLRQAKAAGPTVARWVVPALPDEAAPTTPVVPHGYAQRHKAAHRSKAGQLPHDSAPHASVDLRSPPAPRTRKAGPGHAQGHAASRASQRHGSTGHSRQTWATPGTSAGQPLSMVDLATPAAAQEDDWGITHASTRNTPW